MAGIGHRGFMGRKKEPPSCSGISYGSYNGTKALFNDGILNYLRSAALSYDNSVNGFTLLCMFYGTAETFQDFNHYLSLSGSYLDCIAEVGTTNFRIGDSNLAYVKSVNPLIPIYAALSYTPLPGTGSESYRSINGVGEESNNPVFKYHNFNTGSESNIFKRVGGGNRAPGHLGFLQIIDRPLSPACCDQWTSNAEPRNIVGDFTDVLLLDIENGVFNTGGLDTIKDLSSNGFHFELNGFTAAQKNPLDPSYFLKSIP